jgi:DNA-binding PadR family transcriptional regulator
MLSKLETDGFIATKMDENGDKELVPISEVIAKTLKEYKKAS